MSEQNYSEQSYVNIGSAESLATISEEYTADIAYVQGKTLEELRKNVLKRLDKGFDILEQNPFLDTTVEPVLWTQVMVLTEYGEEEK